MVHLSLPAGTAVPAVSSHSSVAATSCWCCPNPWMGLRLHSSACEKEARIGEETVHGGLVCPHEEFIMRYVGPRCHGEVS